MKTTVVNRNLFYRIIYESVLCVYRMYTVDLVSVQIQCMWCFLSTSRGRWSTEGLCLTASISCISEVSVQSDDLTESSGHITSHCSLTTADLQSVASHSWFVQPGSTEPAVLWDLVTVLELHSQTELQHSAEQLKQLESWSKTSEVSISSSAVITVCRREHITNWSQTRSTPASDGLANTVSSAAQKISALK